MSDETKGKEGDQGAAPDPITALAAELEAVKAQSAKDREALAKANKDMVAMMDTNKRMMGELSKKSAAQQPAQPVDLGDMVYRQLGIKGKE